ncbi:MBL fold metallo-hydrolase [Sphingobium aquiterrae]|uniref:MBL fold metallo-hydrolase n=1 Tax=Sphingobium aquiterrae TaxID=2038656 RepID=UPI00301B179D
MMKPILPLLCALTLPIGAASAQQPAPGPLPNSAPVAPQQVRQVKPDIYMVAGAGGNVTIWVADRGLVLVDDKLGGEANFDTLVAAIRSVSTLPVIAVFNTHHHGDHIGNNARFLDAKALVIGTDGLADRIAAAPAPANGAAPPAPPNLLFSKDVSLVMARGRVDAHHYIPGHTSGDAVIHFPAAHVVSTGDLLVAATPTIDYAGGANITGWIATLDEILKLDFDAAIPGHGDAPMPRADVLAFRGKLATFLDRARAAVKAGTPKEKLIGAVQASDLGWTWNANSWPAARLDGLWAEAGGA